MKKLFYVLITILVLQVLFFSNCKKNDIEVYRGVIEDSIKNDLTNVECERTVSLFAGKNILIGTLTIENDDDNLFITYQTDGNWVMTKTHLFVGGDSLDLSTIPVNNGGNPKVGHFPYSNTHSNVNNFTYTIPLQDIPLQCMLVSAHADVINTVTTQSEGAWAEGIDFPGGSWAMFSTYCIVECEPEVIPPTQEEIDLILGSVYDVTNTSVIDFTDFNLLATDAPVSDLNFTQTVKYEFSEQQPVYVIPFQTFTNKFYFINVETNRQGIVTINLDSNGNGDITFEGVTIIIINGIPLDSVIETCIGCGCPCGGNGDEDSPFCQQEGDEDTSECYKREVDEFCDGFLGCLIIATQPQVHVLILAMCTC